MTLATRARIVTTAATARNKVGPAESADKYVKYWELVANKLSNGGWTLGWVSAVDSEGRTIWIADAHRDDGTRFSVRADEILTAFMELERAIHAFAVSLTL